MTYDVAVIGLGAMGSAAALSLARRGLDVAALEQFELGHARGSSHGVTRIIRRTYSEGAFYLPLLAAAWDAWASLETEIGATLFCETGGLDITIGGGGSARAALASAQAAGAPHEVLNAADLTARFPAFAFNDVVEAVYAPGSGLIASDLASELMRMRAEALGAVLMANARALSWRRVKEGFQVETGGEAVTARKLVLAAGPWIGALAPALSPLLTPERQVIGFFPTRAPERFEVGALPIFQIETRAGERFYGSPAHAGAPFKFGLYHHLRERGAAEMNARIPDAKDEALLRGGLARYLPDADGAPATMMTCRFTLAEDNRLMFGPLPGEPGVVAIAACSGHGFKFAPVIGEVAADLIEERAPGLDITPFAFPQLA